MRTTVATSSLAIAVALILNPVAPVRAQDGEEQQAEEQPAEPAPDIDLVEEDMNSILVLGARLVDRIDTAQAPILELDSDDIAAYGAGSIAELISALGPEVSSGRGRGGGGPPVILVNGVRISSFRELRSYPPEAIERTEVFSEDVAQQFGYSPDQRVVNIILKDNYESRVVELEYSQPFDGGYAGGGIDGTYLRINGPSRLNFNVELTDSSPLTEGDRGVIQSTGGAPILAGDPDPADFRTLVPDNSGYEATANWTTALGGGGDSMSLSASYERNNSFSLQGLDSVVLTDPAGDTLLRTFNPLDPLAIDRRSDSYSAGAGLASRIGTWQLNITADATLSDSLSLIQRRIDTADLVADAAAGTLALDADLGNFAEAGVDESKSQTYRIDTLATARGIAFTLPAGDVNTTISAGWTGNGIDSTDTRNPGLVTNLDRRRWRGNVNMALPITSRDEDFGGAIGNITLNLNAGVSEVSDFGTLHSLATTLIWGPTETLSFSATYTGREEAPSLTQLGAAEISTPNVPVFDIVNNETVLATVISGGNPDLPGQTQSDWQFSANWQLPFIERGSLRFEYFDNHAEDITEGFPLLTPEIEAAFPGRITRDATGRLTQLDNRFVTFAQRDVRRLRVGLFMGGEIGVGSQEGEGGSGPPPGVRREPGAGRAGGPPRDPAQFAAMREQFCSAEPDELLDLFNRALAAQRAGEDPPLDADGNPISIPPRMLERLAGEDGQIDPERFAMIRERFCSADGARQGVRPGGGGDQARAGGRRGRGGRRGGGRGFGRFGGGGDGPPVIRWFANLQYTLELQDDVLIAPGLPTLDLLEGDALSGGGTSRHSATLRTGAFYDGWGTLIFANYQGASRINGSGLAGSTDLFFNDIARFNWRLFVDLSERDSLIEAVPLLDNVRISVAVDNLFDARQRVVDSNGDTPLRYQPFLIDPRGRSFGIEIRKLF
ncbi:hypothetical protein [Aurantiacibacter sp. D1-12]|uniref:hypothetical protein n=1 Tax=Aurantiacibacter sp. D1-12 TaxID=2993658 RepID=UPI00237CB73E|nr:hypothetical protein [Aurantiacibacter sp. D1-12]MDE1466253.1 hypothetical protein [Aurantiacibacter sp. D1-12]